MMFLLSISMKQEINVADAVCAVFFFVLFLLILFFLVQNWILVAVISL